MSDLNENDTVEFLYDHDVTPVCCLDKEKKYYAILLATREEGEVYHDNSKLVARLGGFLYVGRFQSRRDSIALFKKEGYDISMAISLYGMLFVEESRYLEIIKREKLN